MRNHRRFCLGLLGICALVVANCRAQTVDPLLKVSRNFQQYPQISIVLSDMDVSGSFFKTYKHRYKVLYGEQIAGRNETGVTETGVAETATVDPVDGPETAAEDPTGGPETAANPDADDPEAAGGLTFKTAETQWLEVDRRFYETHEPHLGMVLFSKGEDGKAEQAVYPPGYQYVGNSRYGTWRSDSRGGSFWEFYGKYALFSHLLGGNRGIYRTDYDAYRGYRQRREPYFGTGNAYGTRGTVTRTSNPTFYQRQQVRQQAKSQRFSQKARSRTSSARSRSGRGGK